jgi:Glycosyl hydrolases family 32 C terminal
VLSLLGIRIGVRLTSLFRTLFGRRLKTTEAHSQRVGPLQGVPILGLDALGSASYGPEAALTILIPLGLAGLLHFREVIGAIFFAQDGRTTLTDQIFPTANTRSISFSSEGGKALSMPKVELITIHELRSAVTK